MARLIHDNFQNYKRYGIPRAQLVIADIPYNLGEKAYGSNPMWYIGGDNRNGESKHAKSAFFNGDGDFNLNEYFHFCAKLLKPEPKERGKAPCMIIFCAFEQMAMLIDIAKKHGYMYYIPLIFCKNYSSQVLKANMRSTATNSRNSTTEMSMEKGIWFLTGLNGGGTIASNIRKYTRRKSPYPF